MMKLTKTLLFLCAFLTGAVQAAPTSLVAFGDSYTVGAPYASYALPGYVYQFAANAGLSVSENHASGGQPSWYALQQAHIHLQPYRTDLVIWQGTFHDTRRGGIGKRTLLKTKNIARAFYANAFLGQAIPASQATNNGMVQAWPANVLRDTIGGKSPALGGTAMAGGYGTSLTFNVTGERIVVGYIIADGTTQSIGPFAVYIDGAHRGAVHPDGESDGLGYVPGGYDQARIPAAKIYKVAQGNHTVVIKPLGSQTTGPWSIIDYVGTLVPPANAAPMIVMMPVRMTPAGYALQSPDWSNSSDEAIWAHGAILRSVANEFPGYPIVTVDPNAGFFNLGTDVYSDNAHPNNSGHSHLADALMAAWALLGN